jgi:hypothetical protein
MKQLLTLIAIVWLGLLLTSTQSCTTVNQAVITHAIQMHNTSTYSVTTTPVECSTLYYNSKHTYTTVSFYYSTYNVVYYYDNSKYTYSTTHYNM